MKKYLVFCFLLLSVLIGVYTVSGQTVTTPTPDLTTINGVTSSSNEETTSESYQEMISRLYDEVYLDVYDDIYNQLINDVDISFYEDIYSLVEQRAQEILDEDQIGIYLDDFQEQLYNVIQIADNSVLGVISYLGDEAKGLGSAVIYKYDSIEDYYYVITNHHVIAEGNNFKIAFEDGTETTGYLLGYDEEVDIAVLKFKSSDRPYLNPSVLADSSILTKGEFILSVGNPQGFNFYGSVTFGIVSGLNREVDDNKYIDYIQHDSAINPGNSGGPVYNLNGEVIGINVAKFAITDIEGMGFAIPINLVKRVVERIENNDLDENTIMPRLGANYFDITSYNDNGYVSLSNLTINGDLISESISLKLPNGIESGIIISEIFTNSTLSDTVLKSGDLIYKINNFNITNNDELLDYLYTNFESGDTITLYFYALDHNNLTYNDLPQILNVILK